MEQINGEYIYFTIPLRYKCVYDKLLSKMTEFGIDLIKDCNAICNAPNKHLVTCWNMFQAGCAAYNNGQTKTADFIVNYVNEQLCLNCNIFVSNYIYIGHTDINPLEFREMSIKDIINLINKPYKINKDKELIVEFNQLSDIHYIIVPDSVELISANFGTKFSTTLWNGIKDDSAYHLIENQKVDDKVYTVYFYYSPCGAFDEPVTITCKNK